MAGQFPAPPSWSSGVKYHQQSTTTFWCYLRPPDRHSTWPSPTPVQWWKTCSPPPTTTATSIRQTVAVWGARAKWRPSPPVSDVLLFRTFKICFFRTVSVSETLGLALSLSAVIEPPVNISVKQTGWSSVRVTWQPVQDVLMYQVKVRVIDDPTRQPSMYNVSDTQLSIQGILPCSTYLISVSSFNNFLMLSEPTDYTYTTNSELTDLLPWTWLESRSALLS